MTQEEFKLIMHRLLDDAFECEAAPKHAKYKTFLAGYLFWTRQYDKHDFTSALKDMIEIEAELMLEDFINDRSLKNESRN